MKTKEEVVAFCLSLTEVYMDYPFDEKTPVIRHKGNKKIFALFTSTAGRALVNLKCDPLQTEFWRNLYTDVIPAYHMNKTHWNSIILGGNLPSSDFKEMIYNSYQLTRPKKPKKSS